MILIDLEKVFDTIDHQILLKKYLGFSKNAVTWFKPYLCQTRKNASYLTSRAFFILEKIKF